MRKCLPFLISNFIHIFKKKHKPMPIETMFKLPSPLPSWPQGEGFASGTLDLGGLEICQVSSFNKIWATHEGGPDNLGASFFEPASLPSGFFMLGCYAQPNNTPFSGWVLAGKDVKDSTTLEMPVDYKLVWSSESVKIKQDGNGYIWTPVAPEGYKAVGYIVTSSSVKPALDKIRCVRSDFTEESQKDEWVWGNDAIGINIYGTKPNPIGTSNPGVCVGTFIAQANIVTIFPSCLKNKANNLSAMPNLSQIQALIQTYSPCIYFHPDESYLPSSVNWFFANGALLYKQGDLSNSNPVSIDQNGTNLPQGGWNDGTYWLDLPSDGNQKDNLKKGDLPSSEAYIHVKPILGGTFTDIAVWAFYPFNGAARAKVEFINVSLGKIGEHVGDWEHVTLRISNFTGELWKVFFAEHSSGTWVKAANLEFQGENKFVVYSSLHGHASYSKPGLVLQGSGNIGIRNDTGKSKNTVDTGARYELISAEFLGDGVVVVEPPWLGFSKKWGPKIDYDLDSELKKIEKVLPGKLKTQFEKIVKSLPDEVLGEDGPTGPKMKGNWRGDES